jgi:hypothetical protein
MEDPMAIDKKLIDQLLADYKKPEDIIGENGLLKQLTKAILERALQAEMTRTARLPGPSVFLATCSDRSFKPQMATRAPSLSNSCAAASPIPLLPPVIRMFLPVSLPIVSLL